MTAGGVDAIKDGLREVKSGNMVATNLQNAAIELGMALQATVDLLDNKQIPQTALLNMPVIKKDKVDYYYSQLYVKPQDFLKALPDLIKKKHGFRRLRKPIGVSRRLAWAGPAAPKDFDELRRVALRRRDRRV
jgi:hypothetical protein